MANEQVRLRAWRHRRKRLQQFERLEHRLPRAVVPRLLQLERDAPVAPQPQSLVRKPQTQRYTGAAAPARPGRSPTSTHLVQIETVEVLVPKHVRYRTGCVARGEG